MKCPHCCAEGQLYIEAVNGDVDLVCLPCGFRKDLRYKGNPLPTMMRLATAQYPQELKILAVSLRLNNFPYKTIQDQVYQTFKQRPSPRIIHQWTREATPVSR
jgi:hypothetical protein